MANSLEQVNVGGSDYNLSVPFVVGTGSTAGTWLGALDGLTEYYDGLLILYKPSVKGASTTTLNINSLGAKTCYLNNTTKLTTHYPANQPILLSYSTSQNSGCWMAVDNYIDGNTNYFDRNKYAGTIKAGSSAIAKTNIIVADENGLYYQLNQATCINPNYPILYANSDIAANGTGTDNYDILAINLTPTKSMTLTAYKPVYIQVSMSVSSTNEVSFTPTSELLAQEPTYDPLNDKLYILLGIAYNTTNIYLTNVHKIYSFMIPLGFSTAFFGEYSIFSTIAADAQRAANAQTVTGHTVDKDVPSDAVFTDTNNKVDQELYSDNYDLPLLMSYVSIINQDTTINNKAFRNNSIYANPSTGYLYAKSFYDSYYSVWASEAVKLTENTDNNQFPIVFGANATTDTKVAGLYKNYASHFRYNPTHHNMFSHNICGLTFSGGITTTGNDCKVVSMALKFRASAGYSGLIFSRGGLAAFFLKMPSTYSTSGATFSSNILVGNMTIQCSGGTDEAMGNSYFVSVTSNTSNDYIRFIWTSNSQGSTRYDETYYRAYANGSSTNTIDSSKRWT